MSVPEEISARPAAASGLELVESPDGLIIYDQQTDRVHHLNQTAAVILALCDGTQSVEEITTAVRELFGSGEITSEQTMECLSHLMRERLIR